MPSKPLRVNGVDVPLFLIWESAYQLNTWLMKPFPHNGVPTTEQKKCNYRLCRARIVVENAYGRWKARWRRLMKGNDMHVKNIPNVVAAACILCNMCEVHGDAFNDAWLETSDNSSQPPATAFRSSTSNRPKRVRDALVHYFST